MICDWDDFTENDNRLDLLHALKDANSAFRCTLFAIPALGSDEFWGSVPEWCELAMHGWSHPHPREAEHWTYRQARDVLLAKPARFVEGWKSPGWQVSEGTYVALMDLGWWIADHWENDGRRPEGLRAHVIAPDYRTSGNHWHGHIGNSCGNGIAETFDELLARVTDAESFELISEVVVSVKPDVELFQNLWELDQMLAVVNRLEPSRVLEVGSWHGGTLWHWLQFGGTVVAVDDEMRRASDWKQWAEEAGADLYLLRGMSQDPPIVEQARELGPYDFIFIDADHRYESVKADWENYRGMIAPGGIFAFHDTQHIGDPTYGVERLWGEITQEADVCWMHVVKTNHCGIGMLWL